MCVSYYGVVTHVKKVTALLHSRGSGNVSAGQRGSGEEIHTHALTRYGTTGLVYVRPCSVIACVCVCVCVLGRLALHIAGIYYCLHASLCVFSARYCLHACSLLHSQRVCALVRARPEDPYFCMPIFHFSLIPTTERHDKEAITPSARILELVLFLYPGKIDFFLWRFCFSEGGELVG